VNEMARILEIVVYILFAMLSFYKFFNDYIEINKEYGYKIAIYIAIFFYLIFEKYGHNITYIVIIGAFIFIPSMVENFSNSDEDEDESRNTLEVMLATCNILVILIKFGIIPLFAG
jgi:hypothetical protein